MAAAVNGLGLGVLLKPQPGGRTRLVVSGYRRHLRWLQIRVRVAVLEHWYWVMVFTILKRRAEGPRKSLPMPELPRHDAG